MRRLLLLLPLILLTNALAEPKLGLTEIKHGWVGLRPLPRDERDHKANHGGSWAGTPTYAEQKGKYPFVAENVDLVKGWLGGDFKTKRLFMEHYWAWVETATIQIPRRTC